MTSKVFELQGGHTVSTLASDVSSFLSSTYGLTATICADGEDALVVRAEVDGAGWRNCLGLADPVFVRLEECDDDFVSVSVKTLSSRPFIVCPYPVFPEAFVCFASSAIRFGFLTKKIFQFVTAVLSRTVPCQAKQI